MALHLTFIGPAPRYLIAELLGDGDKKSKQAEAWAFLVSLNNALRARLHIHHWLYTLQVVPCTMHRGGCILQNGSPLSSFRAGHLTKYRSNLQYTFKLELQLIKQRLLFLKALPFISERWDHLSIDQKACLLRDTDLEQCAGSPESVKEYLSKQLRFFMKRKLIWK